MIRIQSGLQAHLGIIVSGTSAYADRSSYRPSRIGICKLSATTDASGNAYFYGTTEDEMTDNFEVTLTHTIGTQLGEPVLLLKASSVNPIHLEAGKAYVFNASGIRNSIQ